MQVRTFVSKLSVEALHSMDEHINEWLERNHIEPKLVTQSNGIETGHDGRHDESVIVTSVWY